MSNGGHHTETPSPKSKPAADKPADKTKGQQTAASKPQTPPATK